MLNWLRSLFGGESGYTISSALRDSIPIPETQMKRFWEIIGNTLEENTEDAKLKSLENQLTQMSEQDQIAFRADYDRNLAIANRWDLWGAAYVIQGGCSDDSFDYFKDWLISRGQLVFEKAVDNPESLADCLTDDLVDFELFRYVSVDVFKAKFGKEPPYFENSGTVEPVGTPFDEENVTDQYRRLGKWVEKFNHG